MLAFWKSKDDLKKQAELLVQKGDEYVARRAFSDAVGAYEQASRLYNRLGDQ